MQSALDGFEATVRPVGDVNNGLDMTLEMLLLLPLTFDHQHLRESHLKFLDPVGSLDLRLLIMLSLRSGSERCHF